MQSRPSGHTSLQQLLNRLPHPNLRLRQKKSSQKRPPATPAENLSRHRFHRLFNPSSSLPRNPQYLNPQYLNPQYLNPQYLKPQHPKPQQLKPQQLKPQQLKPQQLKPQHLKPQHLKPQHGQRGTPASE